MNHMLAHIKLVLLIHLLSNDSMALAIALALLAAHQPTGAIA